MNRMIAALCIFLLAVGFVGFHTYEVLALNEDITQLCDRVEADFAREDWDAVIQNTQALQDRWKKSRFWASLTIDTAQIEEIEISLRQSIKYAELQAKPDFMGEFIMFRMLTEHLPHQEGFDMKELL